MTVDSLHSNHFRSNVLIGQLQSRIVVLFAASQIFVRSAPHDRIFRKYFVAYVLSFSATPPSAWNIAVGSSCCRSNLGSVGRPKKGCGFGDDVLVAACGTSARFAVNSFTDISCSFYLFPLLNFIWFLLSRNILS